MRKILAFGIITLVTLFGTLRLNAQDEIDVYNKGMEHYANAEFDRALEEWTRLVSNGYRSSILFYNMGNAYFKSNEVPSAILYYEKASLLKPFDEDIRYNLEIARSYVVDKIDAIPEFFFSKWFKMASLFISSNNWSISSIAMFIISLILFLFYLFSRKFMIKKLSFIFSVFLVVLSILSLSFAMQNRNLTTGNGYAIVFTQSLTGKSSPDSGGSDLFVIHEGTKVKIEDEIGGWFEIRLPDGNVGWVETGEVRKI